MVKAVSAPCISPDRLDSEVSAAAAVALRCSAPAASRKPAVPGPSPMPGSAPRSIMRNACSTRSAADRAAVGMPSDCAVALTSRRSMSSHTVVSPYPRLASRNTPSAAYRPSKRPSTPSVACRKVSRLEWT